MALLSSFCFGYVEDLRTVSLLSQEFVTLLKERQAETLDCWLKRAKACYREEGDRRKG
jgi:hypothetical protein